MNGRLTTVEEIASAQCARYPRLTAQDVVKALYQSEFGCGHMVSENGDGLKWLLDELAAEPIAARQSRPPFVEDIGGGYCRVHLAGLAESGLSPRTLYRLFALSARQPAGDMAAFEDKLTRLEALCRTGAIPLDVEETVAFLRAYRAKGCPATHHSQAFRDAYAPAYRVVSARLCAWLPVLCGIDRAVAAAGDGVCTIAIEGGSATGKTTLAALLGEVYGCNVFHMDDYFLQPHQRTPERFAQPGGNVDYERFADEVLRGIESGRPFEYRPYDCSVQAIGAPVRVEPAQLNIVEGAYSMHPALERAYAFSVLLDIDPAVQSERILRRNGAAMHRRFIGEWIPLEKRYFEATDIRARCSMVMHVPV